MMTKRLHQDEDENKEIESRIRIARVIVELVPWLLDVSSLRSLFGSCGCFFVVAMKWMCPTIGELEWQFQNR